MLNCPISTWCCIAPPTALFWDSYSAARPVNVDAIKALTNLCLRKGATLHVLSSGAAAAYEQPESNGGNATLARPTSEGGWLLSATLTMLLAWQASMSFYTGQFNPFRRLSGPPQCMPPKRRRPWRAHSWLPYHNSPCDLTLRISMDGCCTLSGLHGCSCQYSRRCRPRTSQARPIG